MLESLRSATKLLVLAVLFLAASAPTSAQEHSQVSIPSGPVATMSHTGAAPVPGVVGPSGVGVPMPTRALTGTNPPQAQPQLGGPVPIPSPSPRAIH